MNTSFGTAEAKMDADPIVKAGITRPVFYGDCWKVSFLNPYNQSLLKEFDLQDTTLSTSGNTLQYTGHIMNPLTGIFNEQRKASSILSPDPLEAEVLSTVWMIANEQEQKKISEKFNNIQATLYNL